MPNVINKVHNVDAKMATWAMEFRAFRTDKTANFDRECAPNLLHVLGGDVSAMRAIRATEKCASVWKLKLAVSTVSLVTVKLNV